MILFGIMEMIRFTLIMDYSFLRNTWVEDLRSALRTCRNEYRTEWNTDFLSKKIAGKKRYCVSFS